MQTMHANAGNMVASPSDGRTAGSLSPAAMAGYLRRSDPLRARCFAEAMHEGAAWANEAWGRFWADVVQLV